MTSNYKILDVHSINFDKNNPRIKKALEKYGDKINAERISFALRSASDDSDATASFMRLKDSILVNGGITQPITVVIQAGEKCCIDGNTRLAIYKELLKQGTVGDWGKIPALLVENAEQVDVETIRTSAHLVGPRQWPAYEKARYLHYLYHAEFMSFDKMVALCGGNRQEIQRQIDAYDDMNDYYRDKVDDAAFHIDRFSGFVELQKPGIKESIFDAGFELANFGEWIKDGNIRRLADVRRLPKVLQDEEAKIIFSDGGIASIERAIKHVENRAEKDSPNSSADNATLKDASPHVLARVLTQKISDMPFSAIKDIQKGKNSEDVELVRIFEDLSDQLGEFLESVRK